MWRNVVLLIWVAHAIATPAPTPAPPTTVQFQYGLNGYTGTYDTGCTATVTTYVSTNPAMRVWHSPTTVNYAALIYFDLSSIPTGSVCQSMYLTTWWNTTSAVVAYIDGFAAYRALVQWNESNTNYPMSIGNIAQFDNATGSFYGTMLRNLGAGVLGNLTIETSVTGACWVSRTCNNYGFMLFNVMPSGSGNQYVMSAEAAQQYRPMLTVTYTEGAPTVDPTPAPTVLPTASPTAIPTVVPTAAPSAPPTAQPTPAPTVPFAGYDMILILGGNNAAGWSSDFGTLPANDSIMALTSDGGGVTVAQDPLPFPGGSGTVGFGVTVGIAHAAHLVPGRKVLLVNCAHPFTGFADAVWSVPGTATDTCRGRMQSAFNLPGLSHQLLAVLWHGGERDVFNGLSGAAYASALATLVAHVRANYTGASAATPWVVGHMTPSFVASNATAAAIDAVLGNVSGFVAGALCINNSDATAFPDSGAYFNMASQRLLGTMYYTAYTTLATPAPTAAPTADPTAAPTANPTPSPTANPTASPTAVPTASPTALPTANPTVSPTPAPTPLVSTRARKRRCAA